MSQTETLLLVVLGFALATLIALFIGRLLWATALKLGARHMQKQVPTTLVGLQTERDRLRAEYAMLSQRLGSRLEATKLKMAEQMAEVSRHRNRHERLEGEILARDATISGLQEQIAALQAQVTAQNGQLTDAHAIQSEMQQTIAEMRSAIAEKQEALEHAQRALEEEASRALSPTFPQEPVFASIDPQHRLRSRIDRLNEIAQTVAQDRADASGTQETETAPFPEPVPVPQPPSDPLIITKLQEAEVETGDLQKELEKLDAEWSKRLDEMKDSEQSGTEQAYGSNSVANVISLANRIRDLKKGLGNV